MNEELKIYPAPFRSWALSHVVKRANGYDVLEWMWFDTLPDVFEYWKKWHKA